MRGFITTYDMTTWSHEQCWQDVIAKLFWYVGEHWELRTSKGGVVVCGLDVVVVVVGCVLCGHAEFVVCGRYTYLPILNTYLPSTLRWSLYWESRLKNHLNVMNRFSRRRRSRSPNHCCSARLLDDGAKTTIRQSETSACCMVAIGYHGEIHWYEWRGIIWWRWQSERWYRSWGRIGRRTNQEECRHNIEANKKQHRSRGSIGSCCCRLCGH